MLSYALRFCLLCTLIFFNSPSWSLDTTSIKPGLYRLRMEHEHRSLLTIEIPLKPLDRTAKKSLEEAAAASGNTDTPFKVNDSGFREFSPGDRVVAFYAHLEGKINSIGQGFNCRIMVRLAIPRRPLFDMVTQDLNSTADCESGAGIDLSSIVGGILTGTVRDAITRDIINKLDPNPESAIKQLENLRKEDPALYQLLSEAQVQGGYCDAVQSESLCLYVGWNPYDRLIQYLDGLALSAPVALGKIQGVDLLASALIFREHGPRKPSVSIPPFSYPAKRLVDGYDDGDMALFGGLLCLSGEADGCDLLKRSQDQKGRFWRSPDNVGRLYDDPKDDTSPFTGDQFNGVLAYISAISAISASSGKDSLIMYLNYIKTNRVPVPSPEIQIDYAYKTCSDDKHNNDLRCALAGTEWYFLNKLAVRLGASDAIPADMKEPQKKYGFTLDTLAWQAGFAPLGYQLHLVGVQVLVARAMGIDDKRLDRISAILASRDKENPFFLFLHLGPDRRVLEQTNLKCKIRDSQNEFRQWSWERASSERDPNGKPPWEVSMLWDCSFMYRLLSGRGNR